MVLGNLIQLNSVGNEDRYLYGNPQMTYFKSVYQRASNFAINYSKVPFIGNVNVGLGKEIKFNIPFKSDLLGALYFRIKFSDLLRTNQFTDINGVNTNKPQFSSYVNGIGYNCFEYIKLYINGNLIQTLDSKLIYLINELYNDHAKKQSFYNMNLFNDTNFKIGDDNIEDVNTTLLVPFFFAKNTSFTLPLCALNGYEVTTENQGGQNITVATGPSGNVPAQYEIYDESVTAEIESFEIFSENIYLSDNEKKMFLNRELTYLVELFHIGNTNKLTNPTSNTTYSLELESKNPTKYVAWFLQREDVFDANYYDNNTSTFPIKYVSTQYNADRKNHLLNDAVLALNNNDINDNVDAKFLSDVILYQRFNTSVNGNLYVLSFALHPTRDEPTGTLNFSRILYKTLRLTLVDESKYTNNNYKPTLIFNYYSSYYNILVIKDGLGGLMYQ